MKKAIVIIAIVASLFFFTANSHATTSSSSIAGMIYDIYGKLSISINIKDYVGLSITLPKVEKFKEFFAFDYNGYFYDYLLFTAIGSDYGSYISPPTWYQSGSSFVVDLSGLVSQVDSLLSQYVNVSTSATKNPYIVGKIGKNAQSITGKFTLGWNFSTYLEGYGNIFGNISITMNYKGYPSTYLYRSSAKDKSVSIMNNKGYPSDYWYWLLSKEKINSLKVSIKNALDSYFRAPKKY